MVKAIVEKRISLKKAFSYLQGSCLKASLAPKAEAYGSLIINHRDLKPRDIFIAMAGTKADGHDFIAGSEHAGLIVLDNKRYVDLVPKGCPFVLVKSSREAYSYLAALMWDNPEQAVTCLGVTGTNGKSTTAWIMKDLLKLKGQSAAVMGTLGFFISHEKLPMQHTTADPPLFFAYLDLCRSKGCRFVALELSSHSIVQRRLAPIKFQTLGFTSFSQDHLDFHHDMESYWQAKSDGFKWHLADTGFASLSTRLEKTPEFSPSFQGQIVRFGFDAMGEKDYRITAIEQKEYGSRINFVQAGKERCARIPYWGQHNAENFLCALSMVESLLGVFADEDFLNLTQVPGRLEKISADFSAPMVLVDYAHTPDALEHALNTVKNMGRKGALRLVFGCGGDRDPSKRPLMAKVAEKYADVIHLTSDNPRSEDPKAISDAIFAGFSEKAKVYVELDRAQAILNSIKDAANDDTVLIAGKGHEDYQIFRDHQIHFSDQEWARSALTRFFS